MVGVPRSKGCRICVQRRVKCDQTRPVCLRCLKGNRPCPGYDQGMKFQDEGPRLRHQFEKVTPGAAHENAFKADQPWRDGSPAVSSGTSSSSSPDADPNELATLHVTLREDPSAWDRFRSADLVVRSRQRRPAYPAGQSTPLPESTEGNAGWEGKPLQCWDSSPLSWIPSPVLQQHQLLYTFTTSLSATKTVELSPALRNHGTWLAYLPSLSGSNPLLDNAVRACTLAHLGRLHHLDQARRESQAHYGRALRLLSLALQDVNKGLSAETLSATILLSFYELLASDSDQSWVRHAGGAGTLMKMRGPARHRTGFDRELFLAYRHALVISTFEAGTPCFLDEPEWRQLSRQIYEDLCASGVVGDKRDVFDAAEAFFQEMARLPRLVCEGRNIAQMVSTTSPERQTLFQGVADRAHGQRAALKSAHMRFRAALKRVGHEPSTHMTGDAVFPVRYEYTNVFTGGMCTGHWTILIVVNLTLKELDPSPEKIAMFRAENAAAAQEICRSSAWMSTSSFLGPFVLTFALRVALLALEDETQRSWIMEQLVKLGATRIAVAKNVPSR